MLQLSRAVHNLELSDNDNQVLRFLGTAMFPFRQAYNGGFLALKLTVE